MAFEIVIKSAGMGRIDTDEISINNYGMCFGEDVTKLFEDFSHCEIYFDKNNRRVGLKPVTSSTTGFKIGLDSNKDKQRKTISGGWSKRLPNGKFVPTFENDMIILNDCEIIDKVKKQKAE